MTGQGWTICFDVTTTERAVGELPAADTGDGGGDEAGEAAAFSSVAEMRAVRVLRHAA